MPVLEPFLDTLAAREGFPANQEVVANAQSDTMTNEWRDFDVYAMFIQNNMFNKIRTSYVPLSWHVAAHREDQSSDTTGPAARRYILT